MQPISIAVKELVWYRARQEYYVFTNYSTVFFDSKNEIYDLVVGIAYLIEIKMKKLYG